MTEPKSGYELHEQEQRQAWRRLTPKQRLDWLWQAKLFAERALIAAKKRRTAKTEGQREAKALAPGDSQ